jgi:transposase
MGNCAGVDWASEKHDVRVSDAAGEELLSASFAHEEAGLHSLCAALVRLQVELVAIERPDGLLVERLLDAGLRVLAIHPNQVAATRDRFRAAGGKSDRFDAFVLCELARTDAHRFRVLEPDSDETQALKALTRARRDIVESRTAASNQLHAELERFWAGPLGLFSDLDGQISLAFIKRYPSPADIRGLGEQRFAAFLKAQHYKGNQTPAVLLEKLRSAPTGRAGQAEIAARRAIVLGLVNRLQSLRAELKALEKQIASAVRAHPDGKIFLPLFKDPQSVVTAAELVAEIGSCRERYPTRESLAADGGQSAVAIESGKRKVAHFRYACNGRLRGAICVLANSSRHHNPWAQAIYASARDRGHDHQRAIRTLGRAWARVLWRCWQDGVPYDPALHRAYQRHITVLIPGESGPIVDIAATERMAA